MVDATKEIPIIRMDCPTCVVTLEKSVMKVPGVKSAKGNYMKKTLKITFDVTTPLSSIEKAIEDVGYQVAYKHYPSPLSRIRGIFSRGESSKITTVTDKDFPTTILKSVKPVAVLFTSETCPSCQVLKPKLKELADRFSGKAEFYEMDVGYTETWKEYNVIGLPTIIVFRDGKPVERFSAMINMGDLEKVL